MELLTPKVTATFNYEGRRVRFVKDRTLIQKGHPVLRGRSHMVKPARIDFPVEAKAKASK